MNGTNTLELFWLGRKATTSRQHLSQVFHLYLCNFIGTLNETLKVNYLSTSGFNIYKNCIIYWNLCIEHNNRSLKQLIILCVGNQISSRLMSMVEADCLLHLPAATPSMQILLAGTIVEAELISRNLTRFAEGIINFA